MTAPGFANDFPIDDGIFTTAKVSLAGSTDGNAATAILTNSKFPDGDIQIGHISVTADTGTVSLKPAAVGGASVSFDLTASVQSGIGVYGKSADAIHALNLDQSPSVKIVDDPAKRYLLMDWGLGIGFSGSASHPIGVLGSISFGVDAKADRMFAVLHRFNSAEGAHDVLTDSISSWRLPRHVALDGGKMNIAPETWILVEADGSLALKMAASLGWNMSFAKDVKLLGITHDLSAKIDASMKASFGFSVAGKYILVVGREDAGTVVRLQLSRQSSKGLNFGFNLNVGVQAADPQLPENFDDFIKGTFGVHGLQVLHDLRQWTDPSTDLGQKLAGLADQTALDLLKITTGIDPAMEFDKAKKIVTDALNQWANLPERLSSMLWTFLEQEVSTGVVTDFQTFLGNLANPATGAEALAKALQKATFGDTPEGQFLESIADNGLLALAQKVSHVSSLASQAQSILNGGVIAKLQDFINQKLDLDQIRNAVTDADFNRIEQWLQNRLGTFLDKTLNLDDLKDVQKAIQTLDTKVGDYYKTAVQALTKRYSLDFAATYQQTTTDTALIDVNFDLAVPEAAALYAEVASQSNLDDLLTQDTKGVTLNTATLTHDINRKGTVDLHMPFFDFSSMHVNDAMVSLTAEDQGGGRVLLYQINAVDKVTVANRAASQLSVLASLQAGTGMPPQLAAGGTIGYELLQVKADMRPLDLESRTTTFIHQYLGGLFSGGDASIRGFYTDLDNALTQAVHSASNHLGDVAVSMQLSLDAGILTGWFQPRTASLLKSDQMLLSRTLQAAWKALLPPLFFTGLGKYQFNESVAALLVWSALPVSTSVAFDDPDIKAFNTDKDVFWDWPDVNLRRAIARDRHTVSNLSANLTTIQNQLIDAGNSNAGFFAPGQAGKLIELALDASGDIFLKSLLLVEAQLISGATDALKNIAPAVGSAAIKPTEAIRQLANFAADLTDTFNNRVKSLYAGMSGRAVGPMLLMESSRTLGSAAVMPKGLLTIYALNPGHTFDLGTFIDGNVPPKAEVALAQTLVSLT